RNLSLNYIKREKRQQISTMEELDVFSGASEGDSEKKAYLNQFLATLTEEERRILILKESYGFTFEEIRKMMKLSIATVKRRMNDVKNKFKIFDTKE
ncbi:MAG: sigma factor-like helix-turn-helix DNA-binding protein, partial [Clostridia bacterium]